ncbi:MAG TPA: PspC domain-containing protein [Burkholderiaceae bacterium]|nr:PspC domain-containing protein [Burkholderiaceae bacterium]
MPMIDDLERLAALHERGRITDAEYEQAKARLLAAGAAGPEPLRPRRAGGAVLRRSASDRWLGGVCGGIGAATETESWIWRLLFTAGLLLGGVTALLYVLMWIFVPLEDTPVPGPL